MGTEGDILSVSSTDVYTSPNKEVNKSNIWSTDINPRHANIWDDEW